MARRSRQRKHGGGKFRSERQRQFMWAQVPHAARKWAHNRKTRKTDWRGARTKRIGVGTLTGSRRRKR